MRIAQIADPTRHYDAELRVETFTVQAKDQPFAPGEELDVKGSRAIAVEAWTELPRPVADGLIAELPGDRTYMARVTDAPVATCPHCRAEVAPLTAYHIEGRCGPPATVRPEWRGRWDTSQSLGAEAAQQGGTQRQCAASSGTTRVAGPPDRPAGVRGHRRAEGALTKPQTGNQKESEMHQDQSESLESRLRDAESIAETVDRLGLEFDIDGSRFIVVVVDHGTREAVRVDRDGQIDAEPGLYGAYVLVQALRKALGRINQTGSAVWDEESFDAMEELLALASGLDVYDGAEAILRRLEAEYDDTYRPTDWAVAEVRAALIRPAL